MALLGRDREVATVRDVLTDASRGTGGCLVTRGGVGVGKTSLVREAIAALDPPGRVVTIAGAEGETDLGYAGLHQLIRPLAGSLERLPERQRRALSAAVGLGDGEGDGRPDRFLVGLATLSLLADAAADRPLVAVVDDAHWLDQESLDALAFAARRVASDPIAMLFVALADEGRIAGLDGLPTLDLPGLDEDDAASLLTRHLDEPLDDAVMRRVVEEAGGNPLALLDIAAELPAEQLRRWATRPGPLPLTRAVEARCVRQLESLPLGARTLLLVTAADTTGDPAVLARAAAHLGLGLDALAPAEARGYLAVRDRVELRHPMMRTTMYGAAGATERRQAHAALAAAYAGHDAERRAWHVAAATEGPDEAAAAALETAAERVGERGAGRSQAELLVRAAALSPDATDRDRRLLAAACAASVAGGQRRALQLLDEALPAMDDPLLRAHALSLDGALQPTRRAWPLGPGRLAGAARALDVFDRTIARDTALDAVNAHAFARELGLPTTEVLDLVASLPPPAGHPPGLVDELLAGYTTALRAGVAAAVPELRTALRRWQQRPPEGVPLSRWVLLPLWAALELWEDTALTDIVDRSLAHARANLSRGAMQGLLHARAVDAIRAGRFGAAEAANDESHTLNQLIDGSDDLRAIIDVELAAWRGPEAAARVVIADARRASEEQGYVLGLRHADIAAAVLANATGNYGEALAAARRVLVDTFPGYVGQALSEAVEAAARLGDAPATADLLARLERQATASGTPLALGVLARSRAVAAGDDQPGHAATDALYQQAIDHLAATSRRTELARAHLLYGEWLRRAGRRADARRALRHAHDAFADMGAGPFARRARAELEATGEHARRRDAPGTTALTPQERQVAGLAAAGSTNSEIAERLFISPNTVDYHLRKVFQKLGVSSRRRLAGLLSADVS